jgi:hypothetical protein
MTAVYTMCVGESYVSEGKIIFLIFFLFLFLFFPEWRQRRR